MSPQKAVRLGDGRLLLRASTISRSSASRDYIKSFPKADLADDAQVNICSAYLQDGKNDKAVEACDLAIRTYPNGDNDSRRVLQEGSRAAEPEGRQRRARSVGARRARTIRTAAIARTVLRHSSALDTDQAGLNVSE